MAAPAASPVLAGAVRDWLRAINDVLPRELALMADLEVVHPLTSLRQQRRHPVTTTAPTEIVSAATGVGRCGAGGGGRARLAGASDIRGGPRASPHASHAGMRQT
jgi:hypothetical protein